MKSSRYILALEQLIIWFLAYLKQHKASAAVSVMDTSTCQSQKGCFLQPSGCELSSTLSPNCSHMLSYQPTYNGSILFEIQGPADNTASTYMAVGFSKSGLMGTASVTVCSWSPTAGTAILGLYYNGDGHTPPAAVTGIQPSDVVKLLESGTINGSFVCRFQQVISPPQNGQIFPLNSSYTILLAGGSVTVGGLSYHSANRFMSPAKLNVATFIPSTFDGSNNTAAAATVTTAAISTTTATTTTSINNNNDNNNSSLSQTVDKPTSTVSLIDTSSCGTKKGCFLQPSGCASSTASGCSFMSSYQPINNDSVLFEIQGPANNNAPTYVAVGFSISGLMGTAAVSACFWDPSSGRATLGLFYNGDGHTPPIPVTGVKSSDIIEMVESGAINGSFVCRFQQVISPPQNDQIFPLNSSYTILLAGGSVTAGGFSYHFGNRFLTRSKVNVLSINTSASDDNRSSSNNGTSWPQPVDESIGAISLIDISTCRTKKGCFLQPSGCASTSNNTATSASRCSYMLSYQPTSNGSILFEIQGPADSTASTYVAVGFSNSGQMAIAAVTACTWDPAARKARLGLFYNGAGHTPPAPVTDSQMGSPVIMVSSAIINGSLVCQFLQQINPAANDQIFSLNASYTILLAGGPAAGAGLSYHAGSRFMSPSKVNVASFSPSVSGDNSESGSSNSGSLNFDQQVILIKAHGILMILAWWFFVPTAIFIARYCKTVLWPGKKPMGSAAWFMLHRGMQMLALLCAVAGFCCVFVVTQGAWVGVPGDPSRTHAVTGLTCFIAMLFQPVFAVFRCHPGTTLRPLFTWPHRIIGIGAFCVSCVTISEARVVSYAFSSEPKYTTATGVMTFYWVMVAIIAACLELHFWLTENFKRPPAQIHHQPIVVLADEQKAHIPQPISAAPKSIWVIFFRTLLLVLFIICAGGVCIVLCYLIGYT